MPDEVLPRRNGHFRWTPTATRDRSSGNLNLGRPNFAEPTTIFGRGLGARIAARRPRNDLRRRGCCAESTWRHDVRYRALALARRRANGDDQHSLRIRNRGGHHRYLPAGVPASGEQVARLSRIPAIARSRGLASTSPLYIEASEQDESRNSRGGLQNEFSFQSLGSEIPRLT
jgi:hypothetical protein